MYPPVAVGFSFVVLFAAWRRAFGFPRFIETRFGGAFSTPLAIYAARWVLAIEAEPLKNGEAVVEDGAIVAVRPCSTPANECATLEMPIFRV